MVFPLGMYSACTFTLAGALDVAFLRVIAQVFVYIAVATWLATCIGLAGALVRAYIPVHVLRRQ